MSDDGDNIEDALDSPEKKKDTPSAPHKKSISAISQQLDDLSFSLGMVFPSFSLASSKPNSHAAGSRLGGSHSIAESRYQSYPHHSRLALGQTAPRDLVSRIDRQQVVENELLSDGKLKTVATPQSLKAPSFDLKPGPFAGKNPHLPHPQETKDFGTQTTDRLYTKPPDTFAREHMADRRRVDFAPPTGPPRDRPADSHQAFDVSKSHIKQFTKNVQDLYKRKPKAGSLCSPVYGEDEFKIMKKADQLQ